MLSQMRRNPLSMIQRASLALLLVGCAFSTPRDIHTVEGALDMGGLLRTYHLHIPPGLDATRPLPLVFVFHGGGGHGLQMERFTGFSALSDKEAFIACYPDGVDKNWNDGRVVPDSRAHRDKIDDVGFIEALIDVIAKKHPVDMKRVYATGISNGGFFSNSLGARLSDRFAAIAPVAGGMAPTLAADFKPDQPVSVLILQGTEDPLVPYEGGPIKFHRGETVATKTTVQKWAQHDGCTVEVSEDLPDKDPQDGTRVRRTTHSGGKAGTDVVLYTITGGGHTWPGGTQYLPDFLVGRVCLDIDANQVIWDFFVKHPKP
jgi:polyhydroxybutyrate depolymerase